MRTLDALGAALVLLALGAAAIRLARPPQQVSGPVRVVDGDTLRVEGRTIRLAGMDAPELAQTCRSGGREQPCGRLARDWVVRFVGTGPVICAIRGRDRYGRDLGRCTVAGLDLGSELVRAGLAVGYGGYAPEEHEASAAGRGLWSGTFERPAEWRRRHRRTEPENAPG